MNCTSMTVTLSGAPSYLSVDDTQQALILDLDGADVEEIEAVEVQIQFIYDDLTLTSTATVTVIESTSEVEAEVSVKPIIAPDPVEETIVEEEVVTEEEETVVKVAFYSTFFDPSLLETLNSVLNLSGTDDDTADEEVKPEPIVPQITSVSAAGEMSIGFNPPEAIVPPAWSELWDSAQAEDLGEEEKAYLDSVISQIF